MLIYGFHPVREALRHRPHEVHRVLLSDRREGRRALEIASLCRRSAVDVELVATSELDIMVDGLHNGFVAEVRGAPQHEEPGDADLVVLLEDVQDPQNLGAVLRVCEGAGVGRVIIRDRGSAPLSATVTKTSAGASEWLAIDRVPNTAAALKRLTEAGFWVYGAVAEGKPAWDVDLTGKVVLCLGGEEKGLRPRTRAVCDELIGLPMRGRVESLNVAAAASGLLFEIVRQRMAHSSE